MALDDNTFRQRDAVARRFISLIYPFVRRRETKRKPMRRERPGPEFRTGPQLRDDLAVAVVVRVVPVQHDVRLHSIPERHINFELGRGPGLEGI